MHRAGSLDRRRADKQRYVDVLMAEMGARDAAWWDARVGAKLVRMSTRADRFWAWWVLFADVSLGAACSAALLPSARDLGARGEERGEEHSGQIGQLSESASRNKISEFIELDAKAPATLGAVVEAITRLSTLGEAEILELVSKGKIQETQSRDRYWA